MTRTILLSLCLLSTNPLASAQDITFNGVPAKDCESMSEQMKKLTPKEKARLTLEPSTLTTAQVQAMQKEALDNAPTPERHALNPPCKPHEKDKAGMREGFNPSKSPEDVDKDKDNDKRVK